MRRQTTAADRHQHINVAHLFADAPPVVAGVGRHRLAGREVAQPGQIGCAHARGAKEAACGCAGCYTALAALELYAEAFAQAGAIERLEAFASFNGADFYRLPRNTGKVTLTAQDWIVPQDLPYGDGQTLVPLRAGETLRWKLVESIA